MTNIAYSLSVVASLLLLGAANAHATDVDKASVSPAVRNVVRMNDGGAFRDIANMGSKPIVVLTTSADCKSCAEVEAQFVKIAARFPGVEFVIADLSLWTGAPATPAQVKELPTLMTNLQAQPVLYVHKNVDAVNEGFESTVEARCRALLKLVALEAQDKEAAAKIKKNRDAYAQLDGLRKPSDRPERERLNEELAKLMEQRAQIVREVSPITEDENDAGPVAQ